MRCKLAWLTPVFLLSTLAAMPADVVDVGARSEILVRPKIEDWRCRTGDDLRWAQPDWDDHDWVPCSSDSWSPLGISWRRLHLHLSGTAPATPWSIGTLLPAAGVLYANGQEIASSGRVGARPHYSLSIYRIVAWPSFSRPGPAEIVFATRVQHAAWTRINRGTRFLAADLELGNESTLQERQQLYTFRSLNHSIPLSVMGLLALLLGAYVLRLWSAQPTHREYLWFVAIAAFFNFRAVVRLLGSGLPMDAAWYFALDNGLAPELLLPPFFWTLFHRRVPKTVAVYTASIVAIRLLGTLWVPTLNVVAWLWLATIPCMLLPMGITFQEARRGSREAWVLTPTMLLYGTMIVWINLSIAGMPAPAALALGQFIHFPSWQLGVVQVGGVEIGQTVFLLTTAVVLADRARRTSVEQARLAGEMSAAQQVQQLLVPASRMRVGPYQVESAYLPSEQVGGDFFQLVPQSDGSLLLVVGDVSGKGLQAAMVVSLLIGALQQIRRETTQPASVLRSLNEVLYGRTEGGFVTCCCARIECTGQVHLASAGHLLPYHNGEEVAVDSGLPLGVLPEAQWSESTVMLVEGDHLVFVSDGVVEARNGEGVLLGFERVHALLSRRLPAQEIASTARQFGQQDDITVVEVYRTEQRASAAVAAPMP